MAERNEGTITSTDLCELEGDQRQRSSDEDTGADSHVEVKVPSVDRRSDYSSLTHSGGRCVLPLSSTPLFPLFRQALVGQPAPPPLPRPRGSLHPAWRDRPQAAPKLVRPRSVRGRACVLGSVLRCVFADLRYDLHTHACGG